MRSAITGRNGAVLAVVTAALLGSSAAAGPVLISGDAADSHASTSVYASLVDQVLSNVTNGQTGILAVGVDSGSQARSWLLSVAGQLNPPQQVMFINDETISVIGLNGFAILYVPSDSGSTAGGISAQENEYLAGRSDAIGGFLSNGGGLVGLTQGSLPDPYAYLDAFAALSVTTVGPSGECSPEVAFDNVKPTAAGQLFGITQTNLDGCCWHSVYDAFPEALTVLARANEPSCAGINNDAVLLVGSIDLPINFQPPNITPAAGVPSIEAVGDLDGDGTTDVVVAIPNTQVPADPGLIQVFFNQGNVLGEWQGLLAGPTIAVGSNPSSVAVGLFDNNSSLDLAVANKNDNTVSILLNQGGGTFSVTSTVAAGLSPSGIDAFDYTEDGPVDLAVSNEADSTVVILVGDGNGGFAPSPLLLGFSIGGPAPISIAGDDFDNNKCPDLAGGAHLAGGLASAPPADIVWVARGAGGGNFQPVETYPVGLNVRDTATGDLNLDGFSDIAAANASSNTVSILLNNQAGGFLPHIQRNTGANPVSVEIVDLDGDLDGDLAVVATHASIGPAVQIFENRTTPAAAGVPSVQFAAPLSFSVGATPNFVVGGDLDANGLFDLVTVNAELNEGEGSVSVLLTLPQPAGEIPCPADLNGDGYVNVDDVLELFAAWGSCPGDPDPCPADITGDGVVDVDDFIAMFYQWGICAAEGECPWDLTGDGFVGAADVAELLAHVGDCEDLDCPWDLDGDGHVGLLDLWALMLHAGDCPNGGEAVVSSGPSEPTAQKGQTANLR